MSAPPADLARPEQARSLTHNRLNQATGGIWRITRPGGTAILKLAVPGRPDGAAHWAAGAEPGHWNYWLREALAYRAGLPAAAYPGIAAPELLSCDERPDGSVALWLADVPGAPGPAWSTPQFAEFARRLGTGQAGWLHRRADHPWLSHDWLRAYAGSRPVPEPVAWEHPLLAPWPAALRAGLAELWARRGELFAAADALPRTLCHHDVWPANLIWPGAAEPVLLDWSFVGPGAIGEDAANLIVDTVTDGLMPVSRLPEIEAAVLAGYQDGLGLDAALVERAVAITGAAKYCWFAPRGVARLLGGAARGVYDPGDEPAAVVERWRPICELLVRWGRLALPH